ncbi:MAG: hypothetical protein ACLUEQ_08840 [Cloacibacillus evryensis]
MTELRFNLVETVAFATAILWLGMFLRKRISFLASIIRRLSRMIFTLRLGAQNISLKYDMF